MMILTITTYSGIDISAICCWIFFDSVKKLNEKYTILNINLAQINPILFPAINYVNFSFHFMLTILNPHA